MRRRDWSVAEVKASHESGTQRKRLKVNCSGESGRRHFAISLGTSGAQCADWNGFTARRVFLLLVGTCVKNKRRCRVKAESGSERRERRGQSELAKSVPEPAGVDTQTVAYERLVGGGCKARRGQSVTERSGVRVTEAEAVSNPAPRHKADLWVMCPCCACVLYLIEREAPI